MSRLRMAVVGVGHLGKEHARILSGMAEVDLVGVVDVFAAQAQAVAERCGTTAYSDFTPLFDQVDAVTVVTPTVEHHRVASEFLKRGIPVLIEKPIAVTVAEADELITLANSTGAALQVGHIERFNPAFEELIDRPIRPKFIECERHGPFTGRSTDIGVVLDLMIHDLDLLLAIVGSRVRTVEALGAAIFGGHEDMVNARIRFENGCIAHVTASRISPTPKRRMRVWAAEGYAGVDFVKKKLTLVQPTTLLREEGIPVERLDPAKRAQIKDEVFGKYLQTLEMDCAFGDQLTNELRSFVGCVQHGRKPRVTGVDGRDALALAERILTSVRAHLWEGDPEGPVGAQGLPMPTGSLFEIARREAA